MASTRLGGSETQTLTINTYPDSEYQAKAKHGYRGLVL